MENVAIGIALRQANMLLIEAHNAIVRGTYAQEAKSALIAELSAIRNQLQNTISHNMAVDLENTYPVDEEV